MDTAVFQYLMQTTLVTVLWLSAPALLIAILVGFGVSLFQALTQIQDQTLPQAIKLVAVLLALVLLGPMLAGHIAGLTSEVLDNFVVWTR